MTQEAERTYVRQWAETGGMLEDLRWQELRELGEAAALRVTDYLIDAALLVPQPPARRA